MPYTRFLSEFDHFPDIAREHKGAAYREYLTQLHDYLVGYMRRARPLFEVDAALSEVDKEFEVKWERGEAAGWPKVEREEGVFCAACT